MATTPPETASFYAHWSYRLPQVREALRWIKRRGGHVTADELVEWDRQRPPSQQLFNWDDASAAHQHRLEQARHFLNRWRTKFDGMRVRAFIHIREDEDAGIPESAYVSTEVISNIPAMRDQVIRDITKRMSNLAADLAFWKLSADERAAIWQKLDRTAITGKIPRAGQSGPQPEERSLS